MVWCPVELFLKTKTPRTLVSETDKGEIALDKPGVNDPELALIGLFPLP